MLKLFLPNRKNHFAESAEVFRKLYFKVIGKKIPFIYADDGRSDLILLGSDADNILAAERIIDGRMKSFGVRIGCDEYAIRSYQEGKRKFVFLASGNIRSSFYVVYDFFERAAGCRYFWDGDVIPKKKELPLTGWDVLEKPRFIYRGLRYFAHRSLTRFQAEQWDFDDWKHEFDWIMKKRLNLAMLRIGIDDIFQKAFPDIVPYPDYRKRPPEAADRSYDDRSLFWPLEYRGELRKKVLAYGHSLGLFQPEDCGTMTHWYSRTPKAFLDKVKPSFIPQCSHWYGDPTGLVWDIRDDRNLDYYFQLTQTHVKEYGSPEMFHTIGLAERQCFESRDANLRLKVYAYRRIISKLREEYPQAKLLIASWDLLRLQTDEVRKLIPEFDPENTLILDYTSDFISASKGYQAWDIMHKFPWIFGIFHAFEPSTDIRGMYHEIEERMPGVVEDPMCKGLVFWPENSHQDTLMLSFFPAIAWNPALCNIRKFIPQFCRDRYEEKTAEKMTSLWMEILPFAEIGRWGEDCESERAIRNTYPEPYFKLGKQWDRCMFRHGFLGDTEIAQVLEYSQYRKKTVLPMLPQACKLAKQLSAFEWKTQNEFLRRDLLDIARTLWARIMDLALCGYVLKLQEFRNGIVDAKCILAYGKLLRSLGRDLTLIIGCSKEFSLFYALEDLKRKHETNPNFEHTLKGNAENGYCRSYVYELSSVCYEPTLGRILAYVEENVSAGIRTHLDAKAYDVLLGKDIDIFYEKPLAEMRPDIVKNAAAYSETLADFASHIKQLEKMEIQK